MEPRTRSMRDNTAPARPMDAGPVGGRTFGHDSGDHTEMVREVVGAFHSAEALEAAVSELCSSGWDRSELSLLAQHGIFDPDVPAHGQAMREAADDPDSERQPVISEDDVRQGRTLATSMAAVIAGFLATGAAVMSGGAALAVAAGVAAAGGAAAVASAVGKQAGDSRSSFIHEQIDRGGVLLWVTVRDAEAERKASAILTRHGAVGVHLHEVAS